MASPTELRVEHLAVALGITVSRPRFSWRLPAGSRGQVGYQVRANGWDSGRIDSDQSVLVQYSGPPWRSGETVTWTVRVWTELGASDWATPASFELGLLEEADWLATWIEPSESAQERHQTPHPAHLLRGGFVVDQPVERARLYVTAHGIYECHLNGRRVGDLELTPGFTSYGATLQVQTYDVTDMLQPGENVLGAVLSDGWFRGQVGGARLSGHYGDAVALLAQLVLRSTNGDVVHFGTGPDWLSGFGAIRQADLIQGEVVDLRLDVPGWCTPGTRPSDWVPVRVAAHDFSRLCSSPSPPVRRIEELAPVAVIDRGDRQVVDFGQNFNGRIRLASSVRSGATLTFTHGEALGDDGDVTLENLAVSDPGNSNVSYEPEFANLALPFQTDSVTLAGADVVYEPRHTTHGFRYVRLEGAEGLDAGHDLTGVVVHTDLRRTGWFECSDERVNRLHEAAVWSLRSNVCDIPTDCPTRERAGWTGDWQIFVSTAAFLYDVAGFSVKWLRDLAVEQRSSGAVNHCVPNTLSDAIVEKFGVAHGAAGWGDAAVLVPWEVYRAYGDQELLREQWTSMAAWVEFAADAARSARHPTRTATRPVPAPHDQFLWDTGFHWGEWLEPDGTGTGSAGVDDLREADHGDVATAYLHLSARRLGDMAEVLGNRLEKTHYHALAEATRKAWMTEFFRPDGALTRDTQAAHVRALAFGLVPPTARTKAVRRLVELVRAAGTHPGTGFLATPYLLPVLADHGQLDLAYELLLQDTEPSWLTMIDRGATTIWEAWNGIDTTGEAHLSLNHYSKGAVISFLHRHVAGIQLLDDGPAYRRFQIVPQPGGGLTWARAVHVSPYGRIESSWVLDGERFTVNVLVPAGTTADVVLPCGKRIEFVQGEATFDSPLANARGGKGHRARSSSFTQRRAEEAL
ncbi:family 78 glycoside hydrolase catalytic domain [Jiangella asiatica]|uniref:alpha-L-rhamnosidase n=1 Tax=Jiangella asiatica TaxID=2530372 RepID=A0A4R5DFD5_9ACTN|nr:family 78 glycoside hydrolase catalytic domain [Jiangella asiatica]TDE10601.1 alpha-L-rhamnosidase [Jiangella asiatica]